jgi:hypothetical protein
MCKYCLHCLILLKVLFGSRPEMRVCLHVNWSLLLPDCNQNLNIVMLPNGSKRSHKSIHENPFSAFPILPCGLTRDVSFISDNLLLARLHKFLAPCRHYASISVIVLRIFFFFNTTTRFVRDDRQNNLLFVFVFLFHTFPLSFSYFYLLPSFVSYRFPMYPIVISSLAPYLLAITLNLFPRSHSLSLFYYLFISSSFFSL